ncbi:hypothetical protein GCM10010975_30130 [Comamonas phosphati]|nr:hypothetical protein GCM10010975_30130 [Comamonas phosphati]
MVADTSLQHGQERLHCGYIYFLDLTHATLQGWPQHKEALPVEVRFLGCGTSGMVSSVNHKRNRPVPKPNYQFEKRQREQEKKKKKAEKAQRKAVASEGTSPNVASEVLQESK